MKNWAFIYGFWSLHPKNHPAFSFITPNQGNLQLGSQHQELPFFEILASGSSITFLMPCNLSFPANLETKTCHRLKSEDNLHPTGAFDESRFNKNSHPNFEILKAKKPSLFECIFSHLIWQTMEGFPDFVFHLTLNKYIIKRYPVPYSCHLFWWPGDSPLSLIHSVATSGWKPTTSLQPCCPVLTKAA